jgi:hypothetical protein
MGRDPPVQALYISRRHCVAASFYRTCVPDGVLEHSPAEHARRPSVPAESPTLRVTHLQFEALLTAARDHPTHATSRWRPCPACSACGYSKPPAVLAAGLSDRNFGRVDFLVGLLAEQAEDLGEPYTRHLGGKVRELRFHLLRQQTRVTY